MEKIKTTAGETARGNKVLAADTKRIQKMVESNDVQEIIKDISFSDDLSGNLRIIFPYDFRRTAGTFISALYYIWGGYNGLNELKIAKSPLETSSKLNNITYAFENEQTKEWFGTQIENSEFLRRATTIITSMIIDEYNELSSRIAA